MKWILSGVCAVLLVLVASEAAQACGGCCCCPGGGPASSPKNCPSCPKETASSTAYRYWDSNYNAYLYYNPATRASYYWSEPHRAFYPVRPQSPATFAPTGNGATPAGTVHRTTWRPESSPSP